MKTFILSTLTQFILTVVFFTIIFALSLNVVDYQIQFFVMSMIGVIIPIAIFNLIGLGIITLSIKYIKAQNFKRIVFGASLVFSLIISILMIMTDRSLHKNFFGIDLSLIQYFGIQTIFWISMGLILSVYFIKNNQIENNSSQQNV